MGWKDNKGFATAAVFALVFIVGVADYVTGFDLSLSVFYLIPILIAAWLAGIWFGILLSVVSAVVWGAMDRISGHQYTSSLILFWNSGVRLVFFIIITVMFSKLTRLYEHEKEMSKTDFLTGLANMRAFYGSVEDELGRAKRYGRPFTVSYVDVDNFKHVNDTYGHPAGDELLLLVAKTIRDNIRTPDVAGRVGGDEFAILMPETGGDSVAGMLGRLQKGLENEVKKREWPVTFSIGSATFNTPPATVKEVITKADDLMYFVKLRGKNGIKHEVFA